MFIALSWSNENLNIPESWMFGSGDTDKIWITWAERDLGSLENEIRRNFDESVIWEKM